MYLFFPVILFLKRNDRYPVIISRFFLFFGILLFSKVINFFLVYWNIILLLCKAINTALSIHLCYKVGF